MSEYWESFRSPGAQIRSQTFKFGAQDSSAICAARIALDLFHANLFSLFLDSQVILGFWQMQRAKRFTKRLAFFQPFAVKRLERVN